MDTKKLKQRQAPLKDTYKEEPEKAVVTMKAEGTLGDEVTCKVEGPHGTIDAGLHPASGGTEQVVCSGDMLLQSLVACAGVTMNAVATNMGLELESADVYAEGEVDFRGTLAVSKEAPVGFKEIRLYFDIVSSEEASTISKLVELTERYCVIYQTIKEGVTIQVDHQLQTPN